MNERTCETCVCKPVCILTDTDQMGSDKFCEHWRGDDSAVVEAAREAVALGHNDDCMFCGFKDKALLAALDALEVDRG